VKFHSSSTKVNQITIQDSNSPLSIQVIFKQGLVIAVALERRDDPLQNPRQLLDCFYMIASHLTTTLAHAPSDAIGHTVIANLRGPQMGEQSPPFVWTRTSITASNRRRGSMIGLMTFRTREKPRTRCDFAISFMQSSALAGATKAAFCEAVKEARWVSTAICQASGTLACRIGSPVVVLGFIFES
jgi:hypothetical protein